MKLEVLKSFVAVGETRSFSKAGERLYLSQSSISRYISELEKALGGKLLIRTTRNVELTPFGQKVMSHARSIVYEMEQIERLAISFHQENGAALQIGYTYREMLPIISRVVSDRKTAYHGAQLTMRFGNGEEITRLIRDGYLTCGVMHLPSIGSPEGLQIRIIKECALCATFHKSHPLAGQTSLTMEQLSHETEVRVRNEKLFYEMEDETFRRMNLSPLKTVFVEDSEETIPVMIYNKYICLRPSIYAPWQDCVMLPIRDWTVGYPLVFVNQKNADWQITENLYRGLQDILSNNRSDATVSK